ncbi:N-acetyltransferase [Micromonospora sp. AKA38]|uniref:GNAT family N-acetyltransferase n=1 Tax=Micromonospora sp. AKA38 TaxID=2733861 RepID=UPI0022BCF919|nr:GNAT family N-acetyltransferase [Micromonospora sp. AKA38]GHJ12248.1 N-acetyltransferase [Micromonospora sp. AKA38]
MDSSVRIRAARWTDRQAVAALIADTLHPSPLGAWLVPDAAQRRRVLTDVVAVWVEHAMFFGDVHLTEDLTAAIVGFHRYRPIPPPANYPTRLVEAAGSQAERFSALECLIAQQQPTEPHYHLALLAVSPTRQKTGCGSALLGHHRTRLDRIELPSWTTVPAEAERLLTRYGYTLRPPLTVPHGPSLRPMRRNPHHASRTMPTNSARPIGDRWPDQHA